MATVVITITDNEQDDEINFIMQSDPVFNQTDGKNTEAQELGLFILTLIGTAAEEEGLVKRAVAIKDDGTATNMLEEE